MKKKHHNFPIARVKIFEEKNNNSNEEVLVIAFSLVIWNFCHK